MTKIQRQGAVTPIGPVLRSMIRITIESNNQDSRKVTIKRPRVLCSCYQNDQKRFSTVKVYVNQCTSIQKNNISVHTSTPLVSTCFDPSRESKYNLYWHDCPLKCVHYQQVSPYVPKPYSSMPLSSSWQPLLCCFR